MARAGPGPDREGILNAATLPPVILSPSTSLRTGSAKDLLWSIGGGRSFVASLLRMTSVRAPRRGLPRCASGGLALSDPEGEDIGVAARLHELVAALTAEHSDVFDDGGIGGAKDCDAAGGLSGKRLCQPQDRKRTPEPARVHFDVGLGHRSDTLAASPTPNQRLTLL